MRKRIMRGFGVVAGFLFILIGLVLLFVPIKETTLEFLNAVSLMVFGIIFAYFGITGKTIGIYERKVFSRNSDW